MKINKQEFELVLYADYSPTETNKWVLIEEDDWTQDGKYQVQTNIIKDSSTDKFYRYTISRSGSPFTEWEYSYTYENEYELTEVIQQSQTVVITKWIEK